MTPADKKTLKKIIGYGAYPPYSILRKAVIEKILAGDPYYRTMNGPSLDKIADWSASWDRLRTDIHELEFNLCRLNYPNDPDAYSHWKNDQMGRVSVIPRECEKFNYADPNRNRQLIHIVFGGQLIKYVKNRKGVFTNEVALRKQFLAYVPHGRADGRFYILD